MSESKELKACDHEFEYDYDRGRDECFHCGLSLEDYAKQKLFNDFKKYDNRYRKLIERKQKLFDDFKKYDNRYQKLIERKSHEK